jgi:hypothetical protein
MKKGLFAISLLLILSACTKDRLFTPAGSVDNPDPDNPNPVSLLPLKVNEVMASNELTLINPVTGIADDWIEIYNPNDVAVDLAGYFITDDVTKPKKVPAIPSGNPITIIPAKGYKLIWVIGSGNTPAGPLQVAFGLSTNGEYVGLYKPDETLQDSLTYPLITKDVSYGRLPDGGSNLQLFTIATPGASNN